MGADEPAAVRDLQQALEAAGKPLSINSLTFKVKWGQGSTKDLGNCRTFLQKHPQVFKIEDKVVSLAKAKAPEPEPEREEPPQAKRPRTGEAPAEPPKNLSTTAKGAPSSSPYQRDSAANGSTGNEPAAAKAEDPAASTAAPTVAKGGRVLGIPAKKASPAKAPPGVGEAAAKALTAPTPAEAKKPAAATAQVAAALAVAQRPSAPLPKRVTGPAPWKVPGRVLPPTAAVEHADGQEEAPASSEAAAEPGAAPAEGEVDAAAVLMPKAAGGSKAGATKTVTPPKAVIPPKALVPKVTPPKAATQPKPVTPPKAVAPKVVPAAEAKDVPSPAPWKGSVGKATGAAALPKLGHIEAPTPPPPVYPSTVPPPGAPTSDWREDTLSNEELAFTIAASKVRGIELELQALAARIAPTKEYKAACQRGLFALRTPLTTLPSARNVVSAQQHVELGGSHAQGTEIDGAEVDIVVRVPAEMPQAEREALLRAFREKIQSAPHNRAMVATGSMRSYPHCWSPMSLQFHDAQMRLVGHVIVQDQVASQGGAAPLTLDTAIKRLCDCCEIARDVIRLVKLWATNHGLSCQQDGSPSSFVWALLVIFFLQKEQRLIPSLSELLRGGVAPPPSEPPQLLALLRDFFLFFTSRGRQASMGFSVFDAQEFQTPSGGLFVEDPAERSKSGERKSLTEQVGQTQWALALEEARKVADKLSAKPQRWFHWAEVFDPRELPPEKIQKIQSLKETMQGVAVDGIVVPPPAAPAAAGYGAPLADPMGRGGFAAGPSHDGKGGGRSAGGCMAGRGRPPSGAKGYGRY